MRNLIEMLQGVEERLSELTLIHACMHYFFFLEHLFLFLLRGDNWKVIEPACGHFKAAAEVEEGGMTVFAALV